MFVEQKQIFMTLRFITGPQVGPRPHVAKHCIKSLNW